MRGGKRNGIGGRGRGDARNRSHSPSMIRDHRSGPGHRTNPPLPHRQSRRSPPANRRGPRRSRSPLADRRGPRRSRSPLANRPRRSPLPRGSPIERHGERDYTLRGPEHGERDYTSRRPELGDRDYTLRRPDYGIHRPTSFDDDGIDFQHKYMLTEHPTDFGDAHSMLKLSRTIKDKDLDGSSSSGITSQGMLVQKSLFMDDGSKRTFYTLPQDPSHPFDSARNSSGNIRRICSGSGSGLNEGMHTYDQRNRDPYDDRERENLSSRDVSTPVMPPPSQGRPFVSASSSSFPTDTDPLRLYGNRGGAGKFLDDPSGHDGYNQVQLSDHMRRAPISPTSRAEPLEHDYNEAGRGWRDDHHYIPSDGLFHKTVYGLRDEYRDANGTSFSELAGGRADRDDAYHKIFREGSLRDQHYSVDGDAGMDFCDLNGVCEDYIGSSGSGYAGFRLKASRDRELPPFEESPHFGKGVAPLAYRERHTSTVLVDHSFDAFRHRASSPREQSRLDFDDFDASPKEMRGRNYVITDDLKVRDAHRRIHSPSYGDEMWSNEEYDYVEESRQFLHSKKPVIGHSQYRPSSRNLIRNDGRGVTSDSFARMGGGRGISLKKRLRPGPSEFHESVASEKRQEFFGPRKVGKRGQDDKNGNLNAPDGDIFFDAARHIKKDPPEDSEEFKQQVHKAFLRFYKQLNESPHQQKRFRDDQERSSKLLCCVCGSLSKEFVDVHSLLTHSYHSLKVGLRTDHLGLHKAICVLNGWNWLLVTDASKSYRYRVPSELKDLKEDIIVWPPVVIIHNSSIGSKSQANGPKVVSIERMEEMLKEMGFGAGKTRVTRGKPANQSVLLAKFMPTLSGLQEAERLHKYYADNKRGREGFHQITSSNGISDGKSQVEKDEELLYGYMAVAEDLDKLDPETKRRSLVKSKKEIEAIADAPLK